MIALGVYRQTMTKDLKMSSSNRIDSRDIRDNLEATKRLLANIYNNLVSIEISMGDQISSDQAFIVAGLKKRSGQLEEKINGYDKKISTLLDQGSQEYFKNTSKFIDLTLELKNTEREVESLLARVLTLFSLFKSTPISINLQ